MASSKTKALIAIGKVVISLAIGAALVYYWEFFRPSSTFADPWYFPYGAGFISAVMAFLLLSKLSKGGGD